MRTEQPISALKRVRGVIINEARLSEKDDISRWKELPTKELSQSKYTELDMSDAVQQIYMSCIDDISQEIKTLTGSEDSKDDGSEDE